MEYELNAPTAASLGEGLLERRVLEGYILAQAWAKQRPLRLHLGCGTVRLDGWINIDIDGEPDLALDLRYGLPFPDGSVDLIHSEHVMEHFRLADGQVLIAEAYRVLRPGGVIRLGMPDLARIVARYADPDWRAQPWIEDPAFDWIDSPVALMNVAFRGWEHQYLYDETELRLRLGRAGFTRVERVAPGASVHAELRGLETRPETDLVVEAVR
jgi:predicted SAM-dependent methyltransferase